MIKIIITGTPASGKTAVAKIICKNFNFFYLDGNSIIKKYSLSEGYDRKRKTKVVDVTKLNKKLINEIRLFEKKNTKHKGLVIDSHLSHYLPKKYVDLCIVTKCSLKELEKRMKKRKYNKGKIRENLDAEIFDICLVEALENGHNVVVLDTTKDINNGTLFRKISDLIGIKKS